MFPDAYTVGNSDVYEDYLDETLKPMKQSGGIVFQSLEEALLCIASGYLPAEWFPNGEILPGKVYGLLCDPTNDVAWSEEYKQHYLLNPAELVKL